jgi:methionyl-tRNA formyltransferase
LRQTVKEITVFDDTLKKEAEQMLKLMKDHNGLGLSANQVGLDKRMLVLGYEPIDKDDELPRIPFQAVCNPKIVKFSQEKETVREGCLSFPDLEVPVLRSSGVTVEVQDLTGAKKIIKAKGLYARILQHEIDHLNGVLFTDYLKHGQKVDLGFMRVVFLGSDEFSQTVYTGLRESGFNVMAVISETAKPSGRGKVLKEPVMANIAKEQQIAVFQPETKEDITHILKQLEPDLLVLASYGKILARETLEIPPYGCLNVHPSLLPKYRGATPLQSTILAGDETTGVTIMKMSPTVDAGEIVAQVEIPIDDDETTSSLKEKTAQIGSKLLVRVLPSFALALAPTEVQDEELVIKTVKLSKSDGEINWSDDVTKIDRQIRALNPWPGTFTWVGGKRLKILEAKKTGDVLTLKTVQLEGKSPAVWSDFVRGHKEELTNEAWYGKITK